MFRILVLIYYMFGEDPHPRRGFPGGARWKESASKTGDAGWIPGLGRSLGGGHGNPL